MEHPRKIYSAFALASLSTALGGMTVALTRFIISETEPLSLAFIRYGIGAIILLFYLIWTRSVFPRISREDLFIILVLGIIMFACFPYFMARALADTTAARGGLVFATMPLVTMIMSISFKVESLNRYKAVGVLLALAGTIIALESDTQEIAPHALRGDFFMFLGIISASLFNVFSKRYLIRYGYMPIIVITMFAGVASLFVLAVVLESPFSGSLTFDIHGWIIVLILAIPGGTLMVASWGKVLQTISPTQAAITIGFNPLTAIVLGAWLLMEPISGNLFIGLLLILAAILAASYTPSGKNTKSVNV